MTWNDDPHLSDLGRTQGCHLKIAGWISLTLLAMDHTLISGMRALPYVVAPLVLTAPQSGIIYYDIQLLQLDGVGVKPKTHFPI